MTNPTHPAQVSPPEIALSPLAPHAVSGIEVVAVPVLDGSADGADGAVGDPQLGPGAAALGDALGLDLLGVLEALGGTGAVGEAHRVAVPHGSVESPGLRLVVLLGVGAGTRTDVRRAAATLARATRGRDAVATTLASLDDVLEPAVVGLVLGSFAYAWRSEPAAEPPVARVVLCGLDADRDRPALDRALALGGAGWRSRALATVPSNLKNPPWLAEEARRLAEEAGLTFQVWDEIALRQEGFGGLVGVGQASATPPRLVRLDYTPAKARRGTPTVVLVGKGITFDSGGLSIKPAESMSMMKRDMTGGAVVMATMAALADVGCPVRVVGLVAAAENAVSGTSLRPGDVVRHYGGRTTEVNNTDAEGRLVLADAMAYAVAEVKPDTLVDVATLTGGVKVALGQELGGLFATDDVLAERLLAAGEHAGEPLWRLPLHGAYREKLRSKVADADNAAKGPAAIMAALFLRPFAGDVPWAHLDIASVGDVPAERHEWTTGPSGFGPRLLLDWLGSPEPLAGIRRPGAK